MDPAIHQGLYVLPGLLFLEEMGMEGKCSVSVAVSVVVELEGKEEIDVTNGCVCHGVFITLSSPMHPPCLLPSKDTLGRLKFSHHILYSVKNEGCLRFQSQGAVPRSQTRFLYHEWNVLRKQSFLLPAMLLKGLHYHPSV